jgi:molecular chaperone GrpE
VTDPGFESPRDDERVSAEGEAAAAAPSPEGDAPVGPEAGATPAPVRGKHSADVTDEELGGLEAQAGSDELAVTQMELAERTADLQRLQAEFLNYKRRVDRDRQLVKENATYTALAPITEVLDTIDRAREHAPLEGGFKAVADQLERIVTNVGLTKFGAPGDPFDPTVHEALSHIGEDPDVQVTTCKVIAKAGYRIGERVVRAAQVLVVDPVSSESATESATDEATTDGGGGPTDGGGQPAGGEAPGGE